MRRNRLPEDIYIYNYRNWGNEPRPSGGEYDCALVMYAGRYYNRHCSDKAGFICERIPYGQGEVNIVSYSTASVWPHHVKFTLPGNYSHIWVFLSVKSIPGFIICMD